VIGPFLRDRPSSLRSVALFSSLPYCIATPRLRLIPAPCFHNFWAHPLDELISEVSFYRERWSLRVQAHLADQPYGRSAAAGLIPLAASQGVCTAVDARAYILIPEISLDVSLRPSPRATDAIGTVEASRWHGMKPAYVGAATAFYYRDDRILCLWEVFFEDHYQQGLPDADPNYPILWRGVEALLRRQFPDARQLVTTADDPLYAPVPYQRFLTQLGYTHLNARAFTKALI
ncbi:MAG TPA: hypothetical protein VKV73_14625, partial [Chloroflexota bacterium]|nr:hypothetical protein [Chloroflexota bacterium]